MDRYICNRCIHTYVYTVLHISGMQASVVFITLVGCYFQQLFRLCHNNFPTSPGHNVKNHLCYMSCMLLVLLLICKSLITKTENLYNQPLKISFLCKDIPSTTMWASIHFFFFTKYWFYSTNIPLGGLNLWGNWLHDNDFQEKVWSCGSGTNPYKLKKRFLME